MKLQQGSIKAYIVIMLMIGFWVWFFNKAPLSDYQLKLEQAYADVLASVSGESALTPEKLTAIDVALIESEAGCHGKPPQHGKQYLFSSATQGLKQKSRLFVNNEHVYPVWITLFDVDSLDPVTSFYIKPGKHSKFQLPVGDYEVEVQSGTEWCNYIEGFDDAALLEPDAVVSIIPNEVEYISVSSYGSAVSDLMFVSGKSVGIDSDQKFQGRGKLVLQNVVGGHYAVQGSINEHPVFFLVDTGATNVAVPYNFAMHAGIKGCRKTKVTTANGVVDACLGNADEIVIGQFVFKNIQVDYSKGMPEDTFLLGMSILSQFKMVQQDGKMVLSRK